MAIYHNTTKIISRSSGRSAVGSSAYRSGEKLHNEYDNVTHDYTKKKGVVYTEVMLPPQAKEEFKNREILWNEVEKIEKSKNSQLAREVELAIPKELNREEQINLVKNYVQDNFVNNGMCADVCLHDKNNGNPHAHIMLTMRPLKENGEWGAKSKKEYLLDENGQKIKLKSGQYKSKKIETTNWNSKEFLEIYRKDWADKVNEVLKKKGIDQTIDHRSYIEQGIKKIPTIHEGATARAIEKRGGKSDRMEINRSIKNENEQKEKLLKEIEEKIYKIRELEKESIRIEKRIKAEKINTGFIDENTNKKREELKSIDKELEELKGKKKIADNIKDCEKRLINHKGYRKSLGFFERAEKKQCDNRIKILQNELESLKEKLNGDVDYSKLDKKIEELERRRVVTLNEINNSYMQQKEQEEKLKAEQLLKEEEERKNRERTEEEKPQRIPNNFRERDFETEDNKPVKNKEDNKKFQNKIQDVNTLEERKKLIKNVYLEVKLMGINEPSLKKDPKYKEKLKELEGLMKKYDLFKELNKNKVKNKDIERSR